MLALHIDPGLLAAPNFAQSSEEAEILISRIQEWSSRVAKNQIVLTRSADSDDILAAANAYPAFGPIQEMLELFEIQHVYTARDVSKMVNTIVDRSVIAIDTLGSEVSALSRCELQPPVLENLSPVDLLAGSQRAHATVAHHERLPLFLSAATCHSGADRIRVVAEGTISSRAGVEEADEAFKIDRTIASLECFEQLVGRVQGQQLYSCADSSRDIHLAIAVRAAEIAGAPLSSLPPFSIGSEFMQSAADSQAGPGGAFAAVAIDCCARIILGDPKNEVSPFKTRAGEHKQRPADGALGYRSHITKSKAALRLMLWDRDGSWEFANIGEKHDLEIEAGFAGRAYLTNYGT